MYSYKPLENKLKELTINNFVYAKPTGLSPCSGRFCIYIGFVFIIVWAWKLYNKKRAFGQRVFVI
mgnify:FL=1